MRISDWSSDVCSSDLLVTKVKEIAIRQVAALPYQIDAAGHARVMLITSRESRRWVVPKGNPVKGIALHEAAAHEAFEEAGVTRSEEHTSELQSLMRISYAVLCLKKKNKLVDLQSDGTHSPPLLPT